MVYFSIIIVVYFSITIYKIEQSLSDWILFFDNDEFCLYNACVNLTEQNKHLLKKLDDIQSIIEYG